MSNETLPVQSREALRRLVNQLLAAMPQHYREVLVMCDLEGFSRKEVAQQLSVPTSTVTSRLARARDMFRRLLTQQRIESSASGPSLLATLHASTSSVSPAGVLESTSWFAENVIPNAVTAMATLSPYLRETSIGRTRNASAGKSAPM